MFSLNRVQSCAEFVGTMGPREWLVKRVALAGRILAVCYGAPGDGKSFLIDDIATCVHRGTPWNGLPTKRGRVVYLVAEGADDFKFRRLAKAKHLGVALDELPPVIDNSPDLSDARTATEVVGQIKAAGGCAVLVVDTLAATFRGDGERQQRHVAVS